MLTSKLGMPDNHTLEFNVLNLSLKGILQTYFLYVMHLCIYLCMEICTRFLYPQSPEASDSLEIESQTVVTSLMWGIQVCNTHSDPVEEQYVSLTTRTSLEPLVHTHRDLYCEI